MNEVKSVTIVANDKVGLLADMSYVLAKSKINIDTINVDVLSGKAVICMSLSDPRKGTEVLEAAGYSVETNNVVVKIPSEKLGAVAEQLNKGGVRVERSNVLAKDDTTSIVSYQVDKPKRASTILSEHLLSNESKY